MPLIDIYGRDNSNYTPTISSILANNDFKSKVELFYRDKKINLREFNHIKITDKSVEIVICVKSKVHRFVIMNRTFIATINNKVTKIILIELCKA